MKLIERTPIATADPVSVSELADHLRIEDVEAISAMRFARAAADEIENYANIALLAQEIVAVITPDTCSDFSACRPSLMPIFGPVTAATIPTLELIESDGTTTSLTDGWYLQHGRFPGIVFTTTPDKPVQITYQAGFGMNGDSLPRDLRHAILDHALRLYDLRGDLDKPATLAPSAARICARYRRVTVGA